MIRPLLSLCMSLACGIPAYAGPLFPCVKAVTSKNGNFLVVIGRKLESNADDGKSANSARSYQLALSVIPKEDFINSKDKLIAPATYWTDRPIWSVVLGPNHMQNEDGCPLPLITDDGEFLILLKTGPTFANEPAILWIYRRRDHPGDPIGEGPDHGVFVKDIGLTDLWPLDKAREVTWTDESPSGLWVGIWNLLRTPAN